MPAKTPIRGHLTQRELAQRWLSAPTPEQGRPWRCLLLLAEGKSPGAVAKELGVSRNTVWRWRSEYNAAGINTQFAVRQRPSTWRPLSQLTRRG